MARTPIVRIVEGKVSHICGSIPPEIKASLRLNKSAYAIIGTKAPIIMPSSMESFENIV